jgi:NADH dehydrogenase
MMRSLPVVPLLANGTREYQPLWHEDLAQVLVRVSRGDEVTGDALRVAGPDVVTQRLLYDRIAPLIDRHPAAVPIPELLTRVGLTLIDAASGTDTATGEGRWAVDADTVLLPDTENELARLLGRPPTPLAEGLQRLVTELPEQLPGTGVGTLQVKHFWADLRAADLSPRTLIEMFRERFAEIMPVPVGIEPGAPARRLEVGATVTLHLPGRGHVQVRVEEADDTHVVLSTLRGHPLAGVVRFLAAPSTDGMRFEVMTADKAATPLDWLGLTIGGARLQDANWRTVVERVARMAGATTTQGVQSHVRAASDPEVEHLSTWVRRLVHERHDTADA